MLDLDRFIEDVRTANAGSEPERAIRAVLARVVSDPAALMAAIGEPTRAGVAAILKSADLTILNVIWGPRMTIVPHNHNMWASIGVYTGREDNIFWRRVPGVPGGLIEAAGAKSLGKCEVAPLGADIIHSVTNPIEKLTGAIHIYRGDFFAEERSEWEPETLTEARYDVAKNLRLFEISNRALENA
jgi:predicted metal-dependent enzyme (double-stranded beta helix superfamily)